MLLHLEQELDRLARAGLLRSPRVVGAEALVLCSNDYLGYAAEALEPAHDAGGSGASRLISGDHGAHAALESTLAGWLGCEATLLFSSGFAANVGVIAALAGEGDVIISDALNHASIIDGCRLSRARVVTVPHADADAVARALANAPAKRRWVITESYFSMDGDSPDLVALRDLCDRHDAALVVDEAHALGVFGSAGRGKCHEAGVVPDVLVGTLGKAVGLQGAFVAGSHTLRRWLWNTARSFVFSTAPSPYLSRVASARIARVASDDKARARLAALSATVREALAARGIDVAPSHGPIIPWRLGEPERALAESEALAVHGVFVQAIRPPTVPEGQSRLRLTLHAKLRDADVARLLAAIDAHRC